MAKSLLRFLDASPSPFHAAAQCATRLRAAGYQELKESDAWDLNRGGKYFTLRNGSTLLAFAVETKESTIRFVSLFDHEEVGKL
eukprot:jgi/Pico_ML_1/50765/g1917.t2